MTTKRKIQPYVSGTEAEDMLNALIEKLGYQVVKYTKEKKFVHKGENWVDVENELKLEKKI